MFETLLNKVVGLKTNSFVKKRLQHRCFPLNIARFFNNSFFKKHLRKATSGTFTNFAKFTGKNTCFGGFFSSAFGPLFFQNETPTQVFSCELYETSKIFIFTAQLRTTASVFMECILESILGIIYGTSKNLNLINQCGFSRIKS